MHFHTFLIIGTDGTGTLEKLEAGNEPPALDTHLFEALENLDVDRGDVAVVGISFANQLRLITDDVPVWMIDAAWEQHQFPEARRI